MARLKRHLLFGGFLGFGLLVMATLLGIWLFAGRPDPFPGWWFFVLVVYGVASVAFGWIRWALRNTSPEAAEEGRGWKWLRAAFAGLFTLPILYLVLLASTAAHVHWDGGYEAARYTFTVVDPSGTPIPDAELVVHGPTRKTRQRDWDLVLSEAGEGLPPPLPGYWPLYEFDGSPLRPDARGALTVHQAESGLQFSGSYDRVFGIHFASKTTKPEHTLEFRCRGYRPRVLDFDDLDRKARRAHRGEAPYVVGPAGDDVPDIQIRVVLERN